MNTFIQFLKSEFLIGQCFICKQAADIQCSICHRCQSQLLKNSCCCDICANPLARISVPREKHETTLLCGTCQQQQRYFDKVYSPYLYQHLMLELIPAFKYHGKLFLGKSLADLFIQQFLLEKNKLDQAQIIIPVPLHKKRLKFRGFNQSKELAKIFSQQLGIAVNDGLIKRIKLTQTQKGLNSKQRKKNIQNAFSISDDKSRIQLKNQHLVIVDDVITTGNTVNEVAKVLKQAGASRVDVWAIARA